MGMSRDNDTTTDSLSRQASTVSSPDGSDSKPANRSKANIRVSLACVQCRSKHVKCDATLPACNRCQQEDKPCFYAKSRRGIRDPKKRSLISDKPPSAAASPGSLFPTSNVSSAASSVQSHHDLPGGWTVGVESHQPSSPRSEKELMIDLFYTYFHPSYPCLPPKRFFLSRVAADPDSYHFLLSVINFIGSLYTSQVPSDDLREVAYSAACGSLPFTVQSVQGLLNLSLAAFGEMSFEHHAGWANRAITMAVELGMNQKAFADGTSDSILAESYRRTWWCLAFQDSLRVVTEVGSTLTIADVDCDVDLPCEEWEYESGIIPQPVSQAQYETQSSLGHTHFSSMAYFIDICKIQTEFLVRYNEAPDEKKSEIFERADSRICDFLRRVPTWKMNLVDPDGIVDIVLYHSVALAHVNRLRLRQSAPRNGLNIREYFPLGPAKGPDRKGQMVRGFGWNPHPIDIHAANSYCDLFRRPLPTRSLSTVVAPAMLRVAQAYLDACVFLGLDSPAFRERINRIVQILTAHGEMWPLSRKVAEDIKFVAKEYLAPRPSPGCWRPGVAASETWAAIPTTCLLDEASTLVPDLSLEPYQQVYHVEGWPMNDSWPTGNFTDIYEA
ncbi:hypothetical protein GGS23DRAFT_561600 [Durotheca rogersii]|uniref:uncharacterized protein n=1 Tax=Durotheca rogersii TaxID=419775 RepID=UPI00221EC363|nr:uncharacterized protein GGS23DRAFT_561600 [Durotheca rogersii]KAI5864740.1 hypothetical protein GGS23DRAFT_561600 [Durotheca rogersii]